MGLEVTLLIIGAIILVASFIFSSKADRPEVRAELSEKQREDIKNQVISVFDEQADSLKEKTETDFDKLAVEKMNEMTEYSETILGEINRNHNEVMFLYDMLNEKKKEINSTVRDLNSVKKEITETTRGAGKTATAPDNISDEEKAEFDREYIERRSLLFDIKILFKTALVVLTGKGVVEGGEKRDDTDGDESGQN